jgi:hypothetical protein
MSYAFPGTLLPWLDRRFTDPTGAPLANGTMETYEVGTNTPLPTYTDPGLTVPNPVVIALNGDGCPPQPVYLLPQGYRIVVKDVNGVVQPQYPQDGITPVGQVFAETFGEFAFEGSKSVSSGYTLLQTDRFVTVSSSGGANPCVINLLAASQMVWPVTIKNIGAIPLNITPNGLDSLEGVSGVHSLPAASGTLRPTITLISDGVNALHIVSSHGL